MKRVLVWFRKDLRVHDHPALSAAITQADEVIAYYCFDTQHFSENKFGFPRTGSLRAQFILESLADLKANLASLNIPLIIHLGKAKKGIQELQEKFPLNAIHLSEEYAWEEKQEEKELEELNIPLKIYTANQLFAIEDLPFPLYKLPRGFTSFRKKVEATILPPNPLDSLPPLKIKSQLESSPLPTLESLGLSLQVIDNRAAIIPPGGENKGLERLKHYFFESKSISQYKETRNGLVGSDYSSKFSFWLAQGCLSPRKVYQELKSYEKEFTANESTYWLYFELLWREFFRLNAAKKGGSFFRMPQNFHSTVDAQFEKWRQGNTGHPFIDANMKELLLTGFMSNRGRQNVASFLINNMNGDWRLGATWFESALIDYDVYSNYGNWTYLAGNGNDPRGQRSFNIDSQQERYDPQGDFVNLWLKF